LSNLANKARMQTHTHKRRNNPKKKHAPGSTSAMLCGIGGQLYRQQAPVIKAPAKAKKATKTSREKTNLHLLRSNPPPRMAKGDVVRHAVPLHSLELILGGHQVTTGTFFLEKKSEQS
jgi:hypothetical protein